MAVSRQLSEEIGEIDQRRSDEDFFSSNVLERFPTFSAGNRISILVNRLSVKFIGCFTRLPPMMVLAVEIELPRVSPVK